MSLLRSRPRAAVLAVALATVLGGTAFVPPRRPRQGARRQRRHPVRGVHPAQRPARDRAHRPQGADRRGQPLVPRRQQGRAARPHRLRPPVRAPDVPGLGEPQGRILRALRAGRRHRPERHHQPGPHQLLPERADHRARHGAVDGVRPHGPPARRDRPGRRSTSSAAWSRTRSARARTSPTAAASWTRMFEALYPQGHPVPLQHDRLDGRPQRRHARRREELVHAAGTARTTPCWCSPATSTSTTAKEKVARYFGDIPASADAQGPGDQHPPSARQDTRETIPDRVPQARIYRAWPWPSTAAATATCCSCSRRCSAAARSSRLDARLVHRRQAGRQRQHARCGRSELGGTFFITADVKQGVDPAKVEAIDRRGTAAPAARRPDRGRTRTGQDRDPAPASCAASSASAVSAARPTCSPSARCIPASPDCFRDDLDAIDDGHAGRRAGRRPEVARQGLAHDDRAAERNPRVGACRKPPAPRRRPRRRDAGGRPEVQDASRATSTAARACRRPPTLPGPEVPGDCSARRCPTACRSSSPSATKCRSCR